MHETEEDIASLQELLDPTLAHANRHLVICASSPFEWGDRAVFMRIEPTSMWAYTFYSESFLERRGARARPRQIELATTRKTTTTIAETPTSRKNPRDAAVTLSPPCVDRTTPSYGIRQTPVNAAPIGSLPGERNPPRSQGLR